MYPIQNKCTIYDKYFIDDLLPYSLVEDGINSLYIKYNTNMSEESFPGHQQTIIGDTKKVEIRDDILSTILTGNFINIEDAAYKNMWCPIIIDIPTSYNFQTNKMLIRGGSIIQTRLGIENFMKFIPKFQSWDIQKEDDTYLVSDLMITPPVLPFTAIYGIVAWTKRSDDPIPNKHNLSYGNANIEIFPNGSRLASTTLEYGYHYIKLNNEKLFKISSDSSKFNNIPTSTEISFNSEGETIEVSTLSNPKFSLAAPYATGKQEYWISNGDCFSYCDSLTAQIIAYKNKIPSNSYISPCLYYKYREIYNILTLKDIKERIPKHLGKSRAIKKISQMLATSPILDGVNFHYLLDPEIIDIVSTYTRLNMTDIANEKQETQTCLIKIFRRLRDLNLSPSISSKTIAHNYINNRSSLFKKILSKYGASLYITTDTRLKYKKDFTKDSIFINQPIASFCDKDLRSNQEVLSDDTIISVTNNQEIRYKDTIIKTDMTKNNSQIVMSNTAGDPIILPLYDFQKEINTNKLTATAGKDLILKLSDIYGNPYDLPELQTILNNTVSYLWTKTSGPCLKFIDFNKDSYGQIKYSSSTMDNPRIFVYEIGKYVLQVRVTSDQGTLIDSRTIYVVNDAGQYSTNPELKPPPINEDELNITIESDYLKVMCPNMSQIAINNKGLFWPIKTDSYISEPGTFVSEDDQDLGVFRLGGNYKFRFVPKSNPSKSGPLLLYYKPGITVIKLDRIILQNMRDGSEECSQCFSFYEDLLIRDKVSYIRRRIGISRTLKTGQGGSIDFKYPDTTTNNTFAPNIKRYGGYDVDILKTLFDSDRFSSDILRVNQLNSETEITKHGGHFADIVSGNLPPITGHDLKGTIPNTTEVYKICHMKPVKEHNASFPDIDHNIFTKGCFHPSYGWLGTNDESNFHYLNNKSSVLKFTPGHRDTFRLMGGGFFDMNSSYDEEGQNTPNIYKSTVSLDIDGRVLSPLKDPKESSVDYNTRSQTAELRDHDINHGYRFLSEGIRNNYNDEYGIRTNTSDKTDPNCDNKIAISYTLPVRGKRFIPEDVNTYGFLQDSDLEERTIEDIEIKLNFLNYVNTKDLIIWLDVDVCYAEAYRIMGTDSRPDPIKAGNAFIDNKMGLNLRANKAAINNLSPELRDYCKAILDMNTPGIIENGIDSGSLSTFRLVLLNREHVQNNKYNISLSFSDHASKNNKASNSNIFKGGEYGSIPIHSNIITSKMELLPSISPTGYNEEKSVAFQNVIRSNQLNMVYASFAKFKNLRLFGGEFINDSRTSFTLNIAVVDESDNMRIYDNLKNNNTLVGLKSTEVKQESNTITNSLCNWELILHTKPIKRFTDKDGLGLIKYNSMDPDIPGHNFMCDFGKSKHKHLIPPVNINAPNTYLNNMSLCKYSDPDLVISLLHKYPDFPTWAILSIIIAGSIQAGAFAGGLVAGLAGLGLFSPGYAALFEYFKDIKKARELQEVNNMVDRADYNSFGFGSGEKVLINVRKRSNTGSGFKNIDDLLWYNMEATIFKYKNTKILKNNEYSFIRASNTFAKALSQFKFTVAQSVEDILDQTLIRKMIIDVKLLDGLSGRKIIEGKLLNSGDIVFLNDSNDTSQNGFYIVRESNWQKLPDSYKYDYKGLQYNNILGNLYENSNSIMDYLSTKISNNQIIIMSGKRAYYFFDVGEEIVLSSSTSLGNTAPIKILNKNIILKDNKYYTVIELSSSCIIKDVVSDICYKKDTNRDTLIIFKNQKTIGGAENASSNNWGLDKSGINPHETPEVIHSTFGEGAYGNGSPFINPDVLSAINSSNKLKNIYETFNNHENDRLKYGKIFLLKQYRVTTDQDTDELTLSSPIFNAPPIEGEMRGYPYSLEDNIELLQKNNYILLMGQLKIELQNNPTPDIQNIIDAIQYGTTDISKSNLTFIDLRCEKFKNMDYDYGTIILDQDYIESIPIDLTSIGVNIGTIKDRLNTLSMLTQPVSSFFSLFNSFNITHTIGKTTDTDHFINNGSIADLENHYNALPIDAKDCYSISKDANGKTIERYHCYKTNTKKALLKRYKERNDLLRIIEEYNKNKHISNDPIKDPRLPYIKAEIVRNSDNSLSVKYNSVNDDVYWINIDPKQSCSLAYEELPKILKKVVYKCSPIIGDVFDQDPKNICPYFTATQIKADGDEIYNNAGFGFEYSITEDKIKTWKEGYKKEYGIQSDQWEEYLVSKKFFINANGIRDTLVQSTEYYDIPKESEKGALGKNDGSGIGDRVYNRFNLMDISNIDVKFKIIPRKIKHIDKHYDKRIITPTGSDIAAIRGPSNEGGRVYNEMQQWVCLDPRSMKYTMPTDYLKVQNEMIFRSYYSSVDGIEHKASTFSSLQPWEWIPYEYKLD